jgi:ABC-2 type transport system ATP-binding protein
MIRYPLQADNISKIYNGKKVIDLSVKVTNNEVLGLIGKNGSGKTTTLNILAGVIQPDFGHVYVENQADIAKNYKLKKHISYLPEEREEIEELTVNEYLKFIAKVYKKSNANISTTLEMVEAVDVLNKKFNELSKGYQQRVLFAGILIADTKIIILDEMTDGLDPAQRQEFYKIINKHKQGKSIIISSHNLQEINQICDRVCILENGKIIKELKQKDFDSISDILEK